MSTLSIPNTTRVSTGFAKGCRVGLDEKLTAQEAAQYGQIPDKMEYIYNSSFVTMMLEDADAPAEAIAPRLHIPSSMAFDCVNEKACVSKTLSAQDEVSHFLRYNYARYRTSGLLNERQRGESAGLARKILLWHRRATELRTALTEANVGLVLAMAKRVHNWTCFFGQPPISLPTSSAISYATATSPTTITASAPVHGLAGSPITPMGRSTALASPN